MRLQDSYFHIARHPSHRKHLHFTIGQDNFQYWVLPFGLSVAPRLFSKVLVVVAAYIWWAAILVFLYPDKSLLKGWSCEAVLSSAFSFFQELGLHLNARKSTISPCTENTVDRSILGFIGSQVHNFFRSGQDSSRNCLQLLGHMAVCTFVTDWAKLCLCCFYGWLRMTYSQARDSLERQVKVPLQVRNSLD